MTISGLEIKNFRVKHKLTQEKLGELLGLSFRTIQNYELGGVIPKSKQFQLRTFFEGYGKNDLEESILKVSHYGRVFDLIDKLKGEKEVKNKLRDQVLALIKQNEKYKNNLDMISQITEKGLKSWL